MDYTLADLQFCNRSFIVKHLISSFINSTLPFNNPTRSSSGKDFSDDSCFNDSRETDSRHDNSRYDSQWFPRRLWLRLSRWHCNNQTSRRTQSFRYNSSDEGLMHATRQSFNSRNDAVTTHLLESISSSTSPAQQQWTMHHRRHFQQHPLSQHDNLGDGCNYWYNDRFRSRRHTSTLNSFSRLFSSGQVWDWPMKISEYKHNVICCIYTCFFFCNHLSTSTIFCMLHFFFLSSGNLE